MKDENNYFAKTIHLIINAARLHRILFEEAVSHAGVHGSQFRTLELIARAEKAPFQKEIADKTEVSPASVAVTIKKLEKGGYIEKKASRPDNRCNEISLTEKGRAVLECTRSSMLTADKSVFDGFSKSELDTLGGFLERINDNLRASVPNGDVRGGKEQTNR